MPVIREFWGWVAFVFLAVLGLIAALWATAWLGWDGLVDYLVAVGHKVEPLWIVAAILVYTVVEGKDMLAKAFDRKLRAKYMAEGEAKGEAKGLSAVEQAARQQGMKPEEIQRVIDEAREIVRNGRV